MTFHHAYIYLMYQTRSIHPIIMRATPAQTGATIIIIIKLLELGTVVDVSSGSLGT